MKPAPFFFFKPQSFLLMCVFSSATNCTGNKQNCSGLLQEAFLLQMSTLYSTSRAFHIQCVVWNALRHFGGVSAHFLVEQPGTSLNRDPLCIITAETDLKGGFEQKNKYDSCCFRGRTEDEKMQIMSACLDKVFIYKDTEGKMRTKKNTYI